MNILIPINPITIKKYKRFFHKISWIHLVGISAIILSIFSTIYSFFHGTITSYGDAESHLNIAKRVVSGLTPGGAQLGGIWLPLPHIMMLPFVFIDFLWRTGLAGSIVSGICFVISGIFLFKLTYVLTQNKLTAFIAYTIYATNPNILYMQSTPMTEFPLIVFFLLSSYYFILYITNEKNYVALILAAFFGFCATLSRYDGWFLVLVEASVVCLLYIRNKALWKRLQGRVILFATLAFFGIFLWFLWGFLILGDPLYFTHSQFSAKSQQQAWLRMHELPAYKNVFISFLYYTVTTMSNTGLITFLLSALGIIFYAIQRSNKQRFFVFLILFVPFFFNVISLFLGQSVIFIPDITPITFQWRLFNVRYGILMIPACAFFVSYLFHKAKPQGKMVLCFLLLFQLVLFTIGYSRNIILADGTVGLSSAKHPQAEEWIAKHYDYGYVVLDDYARTLSVLKSTIPMQNVIYIGTKPYWEKSLTHPESYARWIIMQRDDEVWKHIYKNPKIQAELYKYFQKAYTSPEILIFKRNDTKK